MADIYDFVLDRLRKDDRSNAQLEQACGVPGTTIRDIKAKRVFPRIDTLRKIAKLYRNGG